MWNIKISIKNFSPKAFYLNHKKGCLWGFGFTLLGFALPYFLKKQEKHDQKMWMHDFYQKYIDRGIKY
jgi:hypothetical protein